MSNASSFETILGQGLPAQSDALGRYEQIEMFAPDGSSHTATLNHWHLVQGEDVVDERGEGSIRRLEIGLRDSTILADVRKWIRANFRGETWYVVQPPSWSNPMIVVYELESKALRERTAGDYRTGE